MGGLMLIFWNSYIAPFATSSGVTGSALRVILFILGVIAVQAVVEAVLCAVVGGAVSKVLMRYFPDKKSAKET